MRNLRNVHHFLLKSPPDLTLTASSWDVGTDSLICAFGPTEDNVLLQLKRWTKSSPRSSQNLVNKHDVTSIASWDAPCPLPDHKCDRILNLHYFPDSLIACLVFAGGDIIVVREEPQIGEEKIEIVGSVDAGISAASWSPDEELLAIATRAKTFLYMTRDFENISEIALSSEDLKASKHVSVGWGKSETQFKGKRARLLRDPTMPETVDEGKLNSSDTNNTTISWRGDGSYVAINNIESERRVIRVFSRDGILESASEPVDGLLGALSWRPAGNLLAGIQRLEDRINVVFFERNGLRHGQFPLRLTKVEMSDWAENISLQWNVDSSVLAVCFSDRVQLWVMGNYHYYLKQEIFCAGPCTKGRLPLLSWHPEKPLRFSICCEEGVQRLEYNLVVGAGPTSLPDDFGIVAVIDGKCLKVNSLKLANIPPPLSLHDVSLSQNAVDVAVTIFRLKKPVALLSVLCHGLVVLFEWDITAKPSKPPILKWATSLSLHDFPYILNQQVMFGGKESISILSSDGSNSFLHFLKMDSGLAEKDLSTSDDDVRGLFTPIAKANSITPLLLTKSAVIEPSPLQGSNMRRLKILPHSSPRVEVMGIYNETMQLDRGLNGNGQNLLNNLIVFGLADEGTLFANERVIARNCKSFLITSTHLIFTTGQHLLKFVHITKVEDLDVPPDTPEIDERCRIIERGARLVTVIPSIFALVLQMPRGNLETIYPRALVLAGIRQSINKKKYIKAFLACRSQRVDMNILHDHDPKGFLASVEFFVDQLEKVEHLDLFLSQLREEDVSKTMYKETLGAIRIRENSDGVAPTQVPMQVERVSKVNAICDAILGVLHSRTSSRFQNVITSHVCKTPPDLDAGLTAIAKIRDEGSGGVDGLVEHICFLADVNRLYDNALGIYDLDLALLIAQQSQKDPREYLPFLQNLQSMPMVRRRYFIDNHLGRFRKALNHLYELKAFDEVKTFVVKHGLYAEALDLYRYQNENLSDIMNLYAEHLHQTSRFKEAGIAYEYLKNYGAANESYRLAHMWKESLSCAKYIPLEQQQIQSLAKTMAEGLIESKDFFSAATIHLDYLFDVSASSRLFCKGYFYADAFRIIVLHNQPNLLESILDFGLAEGMASMIELLADCKSQLNAQVPRIQELRTKKAEDPLAYFDGDINGGAEVPDDVSLAPTDASTTGGSLFTRYTNRTGTIGTNATRKTSKNRRREERKRARGKKGSVYEEEYLVNSVGRLVDRVNLVSDEVSRLVTGLMKRGMRERARAVETAMAETVSLCQDGVGKVFQNETGETQKGGREGVVEDANRSNGGDEVLWDSITGEKRREAPVVKVFEKLSLLGS